MIIKAHYNDKPFAIMLMLTMEDNVCIDYNIYYEFHGLTPEEQHIIKTHEEHLILAIVDGGMSEDTVECEVYCPVEEDYIEAGEYKFEIVER